MSDITCRKAEQVVTKVAENFYKINFDESLIKKYLFGKI